MIDHAFTGREFTNFVRGVLDQMQPWPLPNSVLVMDNARIHKVPGIREMIEEQYGSFPMIAPQVLSFHLSAECGYYFFHPIRPI